MSFAKEQLLPGEKLAVLARQHALVLLRPILLNAVILILPVGLSIKLERPLFFVFCLGPLAYFFWEFFAWSQREYIVTVRRVVKQKGVFPITSFDAPLDTINNVFHEQTLMDRLLKYGEVGLETASEQGTTNFSYLSRPLDFKNSTVRQRKLYRTIPSPAETNPQQSIPHLLEDLAALRDRNIPTEAEFEDKKKVRFVSRICGYILVRVSCQDYGRA